MAQHRCFSKDIVRSDDFLDLPITSQALYFHLGMEADDRGYVNSPRSLIRMIGCTVGDLEQLVNKRFVLIRDDNLILIKGWRINNTIQPTRLVETKYLDDFNKLFYDENKSYTEHETDNPCGNQVATIRKPTENHLSTNCQQNVNELSTQDKISKDKLSKDKLIEYPENAHAHEEPEKTCRKGNLTKEQLEKMGLPQEDIDYYLEHGHFNF